jgi:hypothetical protein
MTTVRLVVTSNGFSYFQMRAIGSHVTGQAYLLSTEPWTAAKKSLS